MSRFESKSSTFPARILVTRALLAPSSRAALTAARMISPSCCSENIIGRSPHRVSHRTTGTQFHGPRCLQPLESECLHHVPCLMSGISGGHEIQCLEGIALEPPSHLERCVVCLCLALHSLNILNHAYVESTIGVAMRSACGEFVPTGSQETCPRVEHGEVIGSLEHVVRVQHRILYYSGSILIPADRWVDPRWIRSLVEVELPVTVEPRRHEADHVA